MTPEPMPEPEGPEDERLVYVVTAAGVEALREGAAAFDSEREAAPEQAAQTALSTVADRRPCDS